MSGRCALGKQGGQGDWLQVTEGEWEGEGGDAEGGRAGWGRLWAILTAWLCSEGGRSHGKGLCKEVT